MQQGLEIIILLAILAAQIFLGIVGSWKLRALNRRFRDPLTNMSSVSDLLEVYTRVYAPFDLSVNASTKLPAYAQRSTLMVDRTQVHLTSLYHNYYTLYQIVLTRVENNYLPRVIKLQKFIFALELLFLALGVWVSWLFLLGSIVTGLLLLGGGVVIYILLSEILAEVYETACDLLNFDSIERVRAQKLNEELRAEVFVYPLEFIGSIVRFFVPRISM